MNKLQNYINNIAFVIDKSGSIGNAGLTKSVIQVFDNQIKRLITRSRELKQTTRVSVYLFNDKVKCLFFNEDVDKIPSLSKFYATSGDTDILTATLTAINDLKEIKNKYCNESYLLYILSDGENRLNSHLSVTLNRTINSLPENWTIAALAPNQDAVHEYKQFGFPKDNIQVWEVNKRGLEELSTSVINATDSYLFNRSKGLSGTKSLFKLNTDKITTKTLKDTLKELNPKSYSIFPVHNISVIKDFVEGWTSDDYRIGSAYYQITKPETIQPYKNIIIQNRLNGKVYAGLDARKLLKLPDFTIKVNPESWGNYLIYVQSSSTNRKLVTGTNLIVVN